MNIDSRYHALLAEFGGTLGIPQLAFDGDGYCVLTFDGALPVHFQINEPSGTVYLYSPLGPVPENALPETLEILLRGNLFWEATAGATLSLEGDETPQVILSRSLPWRSLDVAALTELVEQFVNTAEMWAALIRGGDKVSAPDTADEEDAPEQSAGPLVRV